MTTLIATCNPPEMCTRPSGSYRRVAANTQSVTSDETWRITPTIYLGPDMTLDKPASILICIGASIGAAAAAIATLVIVLWPAAVLQPSTARVILTVLVIITYIHVIIRQRMARLERLIRHGSIADEAERMLKDH